MKVHVELIAKKTNVSSINIKTQECNLKFCDTKISMQFQVEVKPILNQFNRVEKM